jgi:hypothetical protein
MNTEQASGKFLPDPAVLIDIQAVELFELLDQ